MDAAVEAYRWVATCSALLDNFIDYDEDLITNANNYLRLYASPGEGLDRLAELIDRSFREVAGLRGRDRHVLIVAAMAAMFLSSANLKDPSLRASARMLVGSGGTLTLALLPPLRAWRATYRLQTG
jgi:hypothetical protein